MDVGDLQTLGLLQRLVEQSRTVGSEHDLDSFLTATAGAISECLRFDLVLINLHRPAWDDFIVSTVVSDDPGARQLLGTTNRLEDFAPLLDERFNHSGAYLVRMGVEEAGLGAVYVPDIPVSEDLELWSATDWLLVPMSRSSGEIVGILSVDKPASGRRPAENDLRLLVAFTASATAAVENAQQAASQVQHRRALERLLQVATQLGRVSDLDDMLDAVCKGISSALGFDKVSVELVDRGTGVLRVRAATGWRLDGETFSADYTLADVTPLFDPSFDVSGCYLIPRDVATSRVSDRIVTYASTMNGTGPAAWDGHWLIVPLHDQLGQMIGLIWVDDPIDFLLPTEEKLQALRLFANQASMAIESREQAAELHRAHVTRQSLLKRIVEVAEKERSWIAADLRDGPIQRLTALMLRLEIARMASDRDDTETVRETISRAQSEVAEEIDRLRRLMGELRPPVLDERGLSAAIREYAEDIASRTGLCVSVEGSDESTEGLPADAETVLYRIVQEAITNVVKHAGASNARIRLHDSDGFVRLEIRDDGAGFDPSRLAGATEHFGLAGMRERAEMTGGSLQVESGPGQGTTVVATVPRRQPVGQAGLEPATDGS